MTDDRCAFVVAPDIPFDMTGTLQTSARWLPVITRMGYRPALAVQNGAESMRLPWDEFGAVFLGGDTAWKTSPEAA